MNKCKDCKYFGEEYMMRDEDTFEEVGSGIHTCDRIIREEEPYLADFDQLSKDRAYVVDGSGYYAALRVKEDFGCIAWESKSGS